MRAQARKVSTSDIQLVQNLIERCLQMYLSQREVIATLQSQAKIEPGFTGLVWQVQRLQPTCLLSQLATSSLRAVRHSTSICGTPLAHTVMVMVRRFGQFPLTYPTELLKRDPS